MPSVTYYLSQIFTNILVMNYIQTTFELVMKGFSHSPEAAAILEFTDYQNSHFIYNKKAIWLHAELFFVFVECCNVECCNF